MFSAEKFTGHSFIRIQKSCFFFFPKSPKFWGKKKQLVFFCFRGKVDGWAKLEEKKYKRFFSSTGIVYRLFIRILRKSIFFWQIWLFFFFHFCVVFCVFFSTEKFTCHSFIQFLVRKKKTPREKKSLFIHSFDIPSKVHTNKLFRVKKIRYLCPRLTKIPFKFCDLRKVV